MCLSMLQTARDKSGNSNTFSGTKTRTLNCTNSMIFYIVLILKQSKSLVYLDTYSWLPMENMFGCISGGYVHSQFDKKLFSHYYILSMNLFLSKEKLQNLLPFLALIPIFGLLVTSKIWQIRGLLVVEIKIKNRTPPTHAIVFRDFKWRFPFWNTGSLF